MQELSETTIIVGGSSTFLSELDTQKDLDNTIIKFDLMTATELYTQYIEKYLLCKYV